MKRGRTTGATAARIRPQIPATNGDDRERFRRKINADQEKSYPPARPAPTMPPFRHRMHRVMRTRRGGAGAGSGSDRRFFISGARSGPPSLKKRRACAAPKRTTEPSRKGGGPCREGEFQSRKTPNGAPQGAIYFLTYEAACSAPSEPLRPQAEGKMKEIKPRGETAGVKAKPCAAKVGDTSLPPPHHAPSHTQPTALPARLAAKKTRQAAATRPTRAGWCRPSVRITAAPSASQRTATMTTVAQSTAR